ncbi:hypothetical protein [Streptomyces cucumeris]|uniref:hypothetical protein n=1 Tax=Streptomyces cucumeris TaxID=2962890 RepID=UPI0020C8AC3D|nr:hypothetical protein [Streptomyces sp. NEAU-Y11]MCP9209577.1 hypothetical protein [Streptomyces sp. NEAU-Y11]
MKIGMPDWPKLDEPVVVEVDGFWATWHGGEYIDVFRSEVGAKRAARNEHPGDGHYAVSEVNTTGDEFDPENPEDYVRTELRAWIRSEGQYY